MSDKPTCECHGVTDCPAIPRSRTQAKRMAAQMEQPQGETRNLHQEIAAEFIKASGDSELPVIIAVSSQWLRETARALNELSDNKTLLARQCDLAREAETALESAQRELAEAKHERLRARAAALRAGFHGGDLAEIIDTLQTRLAGVPELHVDMKDYLRQMAAANQRAEAAESRLAAWSERERELMLANQVAAERLAAMEAERDAQASRIELLEHDMKSGDYESLYAQVVAEKAAAVLAERDAIVAIRKGIQPIGYGYKGQAMKTWIDALDQYEAAIRARSGNGGERG